MRTGVLASDQALKFAMAMLVGQAFFVIFCISAMARLMTYHISFQNVDLSHLISIQRLWEIVLWHMREQQVQQDAFAPPVMPLLNRSHFLTKPSAPLIPGRRSGDASDEQLRSILESYVNSKTPAVHLYSGMFDSRFVLHPEIEALLQRGMQDSYPLKLRIESIDSIVLMYSLSLAVMAVFFYSLRQKIETEQTTDITDQISKNGLSGDLLIFDVLFWTSFLMYVFIMIDVSSVVTMAVMSFWQAGVYVAFVFVACKTALMHREMQMCLMFVWFGHVLLLTVMSHASMSVGGPFLVSHFFTGIFVYISIIEDITLAKFFNLRIWASLIFNVIFMYVYASNVVFTEIDE
jgi:hypothetical protein